MARALDEIDDHPTIPSTVTVVICAYTLDRWADIVAAVLGVAGQSRTPQEIILVIDNNPALYERANSELLVQSALLRVIENDSEQGLSGARNTAIRSCSTEVIAFLDDDAAPAADWLERLLKPFEDDQVWAVGGRAEPGWPAGRPGWFPTEFDWVVGSSYTGLPTVESRVRNVIGCSMAFRSAAFELVGLFEAGVGRVGKIPFGCEETELCIRLTNKLPDARIVYVPKSLVSHRVSDDRTQFRYFASRCLAEGRSKALIGELIGHGSSTETERSYVSRVLTLGVARNLRGALTGDLDALRRAAAIVAGLVLTTFGYLRGRAASSLR